jgi:hypothetical protein
VAHLRHGARIAGVGHEAVSGKIGAISGVEPAELRLGAGECVGVLIQKELRGAARRRVRVERCLQQSGVDRVGLAPDRGQAVVFGLPDRERARGPEVAFVQLRATWVEGFPPGDA